MKKEETQELIELSLKTFGKRYGYKKLMNHGLVVGTDQDHSYKVRRVKLDALQVKNYMIGLLKQRENKNESKVD
jgi:hypothetical protein